MPQSARIWRVDGGSLSKIESSALGREEQLEDWLEEDISILSEDLLIIGRQVDTDIAGAVDLLGLNPAGDPVVIELKKDKTPRQVVAQALDYASWVVDLSREEIEDQAEQYLDEPLEKNFRDRFGVALPEVLGESHEILVVGASIDARSERIIDYLSEIHGVSINAATFQYFNDEDTGSLLSRVFLIDPEKVETSARRKGTSKRKPDLTREELERLADKQGVGEWYRRIRDALKPLVATTRTTQVSLPFVVDLEDTPYDYQRGVVFSLWPDPGLWPDEHKDREEGLYFQAYTYRLAAWADASEEAIREILPSDHGDWQYGKGDVDEQWRGADGFFLEDVEVNRFIEGMEELAGRRSPSPQ